MTSVAAAAAIDGNRRLINRTGAAVALILILTLDLAIGAIMFVEIPEKNHDIVLMLMNTLANAVIGIVGYFFGASVSNARQGEIIATQANTAAKLADTAAAVASGLVKPAWIRQEDWDKMTDADKTAVIARGQP